LFDVLVCPRSPQARTPGTHKKDSHIVGAFLIDDVYVLGV